MKCLLLMLAVFATAALDEKTRYDNYKVYTLKVINDEQLKFLKELKENSQNIFWSFSTQKSEVDIMVAPHQAHNYKELVDYLKIEGFLKIENVQKLIDEESPMRQSRAFDWRSYATFDEINAWLDQRVAQYPNLLQSEIIGYSTENRPIRLIRLSAKAGNPVIFIEANIHGLEWIASATTTWLFNELLTSTDAEIRDLATNIDWHIIFVANPDGFVFTHSSNRFWRKNRSVNTGSKCRGTDPNRNFDWHWKELGEPDASNPCSDTYAGTAAFSEPETSAIRDYYARITSRARVYLSMHSFGQYLLLPFAHTKTPPNDHAALMSIGEATVNAIRTRYNTEYVVGSTAAVLYRASGIGADWAYGVHHTNVSYTFEFRDSRKGSHGHLLPPDQIIPNSLEVMVGIRALVKQARKLGRL